MKVRKSLEDLASEGMRDLSPRLGWGVRDIVELAVFGKRLDWQAGLGSIEAGPEIRTV